MGGPGRSARREGRPSLLIAALLVAPVSLPATAAAARHPQTCTAPSGGPLPWCPAWLGRWWRLCRPRCSRTRWPPRASCGRRPGRRPWQSSRRSRRSRRSRGSSRCSSSRRLRQRLRLRERLRPEPTSLRCGRGRSSRWLVQPAAAACWVLRLQPSRRCSPGQLSRWVAAAACSAPPPRRQQLPSRRPPSLPPREQLSLRQQRRCRHLQLSQ